MKQRLAHEFDWQERPERGQKRGRVLSVDELRERAGLPMPHVRRELRTPHDGRERPRIVWRREPALAE
jgi:hypothetical protein